HRRDAAAPESTGNRMVGQGSRAGGQGRAGSTHACHVHFWGQIVSLTAAEVAEIMRLVEKGGFDELVLDMDGTKLTIRRGLAAAGSIEPINHADDARASAASVAGPTAAASTPVVESGMHAVTAPLLGTFYRSPKPGAPPFVEVGSTVDEETIVGIIEVMKLMNSV